MDCTNIRVSLAVGYRMLWVGRDVSCPHPATARTTPCRCSVITPDCNYLGGVLSHGSDMFKVMHGENVFGDKMLRLWGGCGADALEMHGKAACNGER